MKQYLSQMDEARFGFRTIQGRDIDVSSYAGFQEFCLSEKAELAIVRVDSRQLDLIQKMEEDGYRLMDTLVYYTFKYAKKEIPEVVNSHTLRFVQPDDVDAILEIAKASFEGYYGHYHADSKLPDDKCDEVYVDWASKSVTSRDVSDEVLVVEGNNRLDGFATLRKNNEVEGEGVLFGVAPHAQGQGIYRSMMIHGMLWCKKQGFERMVVSTQITNIAVQKVWARLGFEMDHSYYTLHKWF